MNLIPSRMERFEWAYDYAAGKAYSIKSGANCYGPASPCIMAMPERRISGIARLRKLAHYISIGLLIKIN